MEFMDTSRAILCCQDGTRIERTIPPPGFARRFITQEGVFVLKRALYRLLDGAVKCVGYVYTQRTGEHREGKP